MDKRSRELYSDDILTEALARYGVAKGAEQELDGFENWVYQYDKGGRGYILRISHSLHRTFDATQGEVEWINYLADGGVPAARAVPLAHGALVERIDARDGSHFNAVSFERARGDYPTESDWQGGLIVQLGRIMGRMHALTKHFQPSQPQFKRPEWFEDYNGPEGWAERYLPPSEALVIGKSHALLDYLRTLPKDAASYGLIHEDMHGGNFFVDEDHITLFDFDDCQYAWFAYDVAMALFYVLPHHCEGKEDADFARRALDGLMEGYSRENALDPAWLKQIPVFLKLREIDLYIAIHRSFDLNDLDEWCSSFMCGRKAKIEHDVPYVELSLEG